MVVDNSKYEEGKNPCSYNHISVVDHDIVSWQWYSASNKILNRVQFGPQVKVKYTPKFVFGQRRQCCPWELTNGVKFSQNKTYGTIVIMTFASCIFINREFCIPGLPNIWSKWKIVAINFDLWSNSNNTMLSFKQIQHTIVEIE